MKIALTLLLMLLSYPASAGMLTPFIEETIQVTPGREYVLGSGKEKPLIVKNTGRRDIDVKVEILPVRSDELKDGYKPLPDKSWIQVSEEALTIVPGEWGETEVLINIPRSGDNYGQKYAAALMIVSVAGPGRVETALRSRLFIETARRRTFWMRIFGR